MISTSSQDTSNSNTIIDAMLVHKLAECKFGWERNLLLKKPWSVSDALYDAFSTEAEYPDSHPIVDDFGSVVPKELGVSALIMFHCAQQHDDVGYWTYGGPMFYEAKVGSNHIVFSSECKDLLCKLLNIKSEAVHRHLEKMKDDRTLIDITFHHGDRLYLGTSDSEFYKLGKVKHILMTYLEVTTMYLTEEEIDAGKKGYFTNQTEYFPHRYLVEAVMAFDKRLNSKMPYRCGRDSYSIQEVSEINKKDDVL